jgi:two-component system sensor histidine kinase CpxA
MTLAGFGLLALETVRAERLAKRWRSVTGDVFAFYATTIAKDHEDSHTWGAKEFLTDLNTRTGIRGWLFDAQGHEVSGHAHQALQAHSSWRNKPMRQLMELSKQNQRTEFATLGQITLAAHTTQAPSGKSYCLVGELPAARFGPWEANPQIQGLRLLAILAAAGLVSWLLSRQLVTPIETLRAATQRLASGDLAARTGTQLESRHDELSQLAHDFDLMAERIESLLREQEHLVSVQRRLLRDVAHELRSPLARLIVALELTRDSLKTTSQATSAPVDSLIVDSENPTLVSVATNTHASLDRIERESGRLSEMIDRLLMLARLDSGVQAPEAAIVNLTALVYAVAADADFEARPTRRVVTVSECEDCTTKGTPDLLRSALENVMRNALRYTPEDTSVDVDLRRDGNWAVVTVRDHGPGVPEGELNELFQPFYRASPTVGTTITGQGSTGLGLAITERAIHLHGGTINATNALGGGLLVTIRLPLREFGS